VIELFGFQSQASSQIAERFAKYWNDRPFRGTISKPRLVPFYQALEAITGAGKTAILAETIERMRPIFPIQPIVMWLSKGRVVVSQTYANLSSGGKYHHLIGSYAIHLLSEYRPEFAKDDSEAHLFFATVGTFNQKDKELGERLIFKSDIDTADISTWEALKQRENRHGIRRPLVIVYDEAQNLSDQQTELLFELEPDAFLIASATMRTPAKIGRIITELKDVGWDDVSLVTVVPPGVVALSGLIKDALSIGGYQSPMERTIDEMLADLAKATVATEAERLPFRPKAIYVCKTNIVEGNSLQRDDPKRPLAQRQAPPILIWRYLVEEKGVDPATIAVYCSLDFDRGHPAPKEFVLFKGDADYADFISRDFRHVIFNLSLQEGWDDPSCYFAYIDKSMGSSVQVEQLVGRVLRQPAARHYEAEVLNTAHFYIRVDNKNVFADVIDRIRERVQRDAPEVRITTYGLGLGSRPIEYPVESTRTVPKVYADSSAALEPIAALIADADDYQGDSGANVRGEGARALIQQRVGDKTAAELKWVPMEHNNPVSARWVFQRAVLRLYPKALDLAGSDDPKFDAKVEIGSRAFKKMERLASDVVEAYFQHVRLRQRPHNPYEVGSLYADPAKVQTFTNALHSGYAGLNRFEREFAEAVDRAGFPWARNPPRTGFGVPLVKIGPTNEFYPDFLVWRDKDVFALDTTGGHLLHEKTARKLLTIAPDPRSSSRLYIKLISRGRWNEKVEHLSKDGFTVWRLREGRDFGFQHVNTVDEAVVACLRADLEAGVNK